jgi:hypothetical protein
MTKYETSNDETMTNAPMTNDQMTNDQTRKAPGAHPGLEISAPSFSSAFVSSFEVRPSSLFREFEVSSFVISCAKTTVLSESS